MNRLAITSTTAVVVALAATLSGCGVFADKGTGKTVTESRLATDFTSIELEGLGDVTVNVGTDYSLTVVADSAIIDDVTTSVVDGALILDKTFKVGDPHIEFVIGVPSLTSFDLDGAGNVTITGISGSRFAASVTGAGDVTLAGTVERLTLDLSGAGTITSTALPASDVVATLAGTGTIRPFATDTLDAQIAGVGEILYQGDPTVTSSVAGVGRVDKD